ncbi:MAG: hypothetical protein CME06_03200 [Gemmatimonadetes bacterium]|nr:hypothetical protein [Gemmatimonadota bacterium]
MKVVLAISPWSHSDAYPPSKGKRTIGSGIFGALGGATPPLGLLYLSASLKNAGHQTRIVDGFFAKGEDFESEILSFKPDLIGFWCTQLSWPWANATIRRLDSRLPGARFVIGGAFLSTDWRTELSCGDCAALDYVIQGDAEETIVELCDVVRGRRTPDTVRGLVWRRDGDIVVNSRRALPDHLDHVPFPDYDAIDIRRYKPAIGSYKYVPSVNMMTERGCGSSCSFCHSANSLRKRSVDDVIAEIEWLRGRFGVRHLLFFTETFTADREFVLEYCSKLRERSIRIAWTCNSRVDTIDEELLGIMRDAGCWRLQFGAESGVQKQLDTIHKGVSLEQIRRGIEMTRRAKIESFVSFMFGIPGESYGEGLETIRFAKSLPIDYANFLNFTPLSGTRFWKHLDRHGHSLGPPAFHLLSFVPHSMTYDELADLMVRSYKEFYFRPGYLARRALRQRSIEDVKRNLRGLIAFLRLNAKGDFGASRSPSAGSNARR